MIKTAREIYFVIWMLALPVHLQSQVYASRNIFTGEWHTAYGPNDGGSFTSNDNPVRISIVGTISPENLVGNEPGYHAHNCANPATDK